ncbi:VWA domain-containing protein [Bacteroides sp. 519]|uniref:vWA domain-containing protein n=1 Tax=Bacteroides sp. 519 TaxID=2302937 RepID=UPI0013D4DAE9|nr:VWA domain-containing protein [Bacteroides sp. 519]NDV56624.1 VWA domain-containing protein [Bacteroides sp. 519]
MKKFFLSAVMMAVVLTTVCNGAKASNDNSTKIQVAILLDTSSSMNGLINQAKSRLWNIVNTLTTLKFKGKSPDIEIALYEYGNSELRVEDDYIRQVMPLSNDLDLLSDKLFGLTTNGGYEYCGAVIKKAVDKLDWGKGDADMKLIYIAGNEPFNQGEIDYKLAINDALKKNIYVNTIHCGDARWGIDGWKEGAAIGKGKFFNIDHNATIRFISTPFDDRISTFNIQLNNTYIGYGRIGNARKESQMKQDNYAQLISSSNYAERVVSKTKRVYNNSSWDLVDMYKEDKNIIEKLDKKELPAELQNKDKKGIEDFIKQKETERISLQKQIDELAKKRQAYIDEQMKKEGDGGDDLGKAINQSVIDLALTMGYEVE